MSKPTDVLGWATSGTRRVEPTLMEKIDGFAAAAKLPAQYANWLWGVAGDWVIWLNDRLHDGYVLGTLGKLARFVGEDAYGQITDGTDLIPLKVGRATDQYGAVTSKWLDRCRVAAGSTSIPSSGSTVTITFGSESYDSNDMWSSGDGSKVYAKDSGVYHCNGYASVGVSGGSLSAVGIYLYHNGSALIGSFVGAAAGTSVTVCTQGDYSFAANDYVQLKVYATFTGSAQVTSAVMAVHRVG